MKKILFVCRANIGRSQIAEVLARRELAPDFATASAGTYTLGRDGESREGLTIGSFGDAVGPLLEVCLEEGFDISNSRIKQLTSGMVDNSDIVVSMAEIDTEPAYLKESPKLIRWNIVDPKGMSTDDTREIKNLIKEHIMDFKNNYDTKDLWFKKKKYGLGWTPANWKGWVVTALFMAVVIASVINVGDSSSVKEVIFAVIRVSAWSAIFLFIAYKKGEKLEWRWGSKKEIN